MSQTLPPPVSAGQNQKPSIGRMVHFFDRGVERKGKRLGPYAAVIAYAYADGRCDLSRLYAPGDVASLDNALLHVSEATVADHVDDDSWWSWPERV